MSTPETPPSAGGDDPGRGLSGVQRAGVVLGALAVLLIVFVVLRGGNDNGDSSSSSNAQTTATQSPSTSTSTATGETGSTSTATSTPTTTSTTTSTPAEPAVRTINVVNGQPEGGIKTISYDKGDQVRLKVSSDVADEIHVHGYDLMKDVEKGGSVEFSFPASIEGRFEIELENAGTQIANLEVDPA
jgi:hypothetical protein